MHDCNVFRMHPDNLAMPNQDGENKVETPLSLLPPTTPAHQFTPADFIKKIIKINSSLFSNFKDGKF